MNFSYRFLQGREGASGHVRIREGGQQITARGLKGNAECMVYQWNAGRAHRIAQGQTDESGYIQFASLPEGNIFLSQDNRAVLWESDMGEEYYWRACEVLRQENAIDPAKQKNDVDPIESSDDGMVVSTLENKYELAPEMEMTEKNEKRQEKETYTLRSPRKGEHVDALPEIIFPGRAAALKRYFQSCPPMRPFEAPGWRFVRVPSPIPGAAYCAIGYLARNGRAEKIAYAIPGTPHHPPALLSGYSYHQGYWITVMYAEDAQATARKE